jgi:hypothetical protein
MSILKKEFKNPHKANLLINKDLNKSFIKRNNLMHYPSSVKEWYNSVYNFYKKNSMFLYNTNIHTILYTYFNYIKIKPISNNNKLEVYYEKYYTYRVYINNPEIKQFNNKVNITVYIYNRNIIYLYNNLILYNKLLNKLNTFIEKYNKYNYVDNIYRHIIYKYEFIKLSIILYKNKFNIKNLLYLNNILSNLYNKKVELNVINLKYLYLDSNILAVSVARKLKYKRMYVLGIIRLALSLSKKSYENDYYNHFVDKYSIDNILINNKSELFYNKNDAILNLNIIDKPYNYKGRIIFYYLNNKIISGIKLQSAGRLTKRLTASRSMTKADQIGNLKNNKSSLRGLSTFMLKGYVKSNLQYTNINSYKRIGSYGIKSWVSNT